MNIASMIQQLAGKSDAPLQLCIVDAVDRSARTVDCTPLDDSAPLLGCNLQACQGSKHGYLLYPKVGSYVLVGLLAGYSAGLVLLTDEVEELQITLGDCSLQMTEQEIVLNGGKLGGIVKVEGLTSRLNAIEDDINKLKRQCSFWVPAPSDGGAALKASLLSWASKPLVKTQREAVENELIKH